MPVPGRRWPALPLVLGSLVPAWWVASATAARADADTDAASIYQSLSSQLGRNVGLLASVGAQADDTATHLAGVTATLTDTKAQLDTTLAQIGDLKQVVRSRAAFIYQHSSQANVAVADIAHVQDLTSGRKYADAATSTDTAKIVHLGHTADDLDARVQQLTADVQHAQDDVARQQTLLAQAGAVTVIGDPQLTAAQIAAWFNSRVSHYRLSGTTSILDLAQLYVDEGRAEHVRPEPTFAQAIIETGWFKNATDNNYAGIGACDSCTGEPSFPTPTDGVRGQIQMLRNYADPSSRAANLAHPPSPTIYGSNPAAAAASYDSFFAKGRVPTWNLMGNGNWATSTNYAPKVLGLYFDMMSFAATHS